MILNNKETSFQPQNIGSIGHLIKQCHPCNKFVFGKPNSCKHENKCIYCHSKDHERSKHRGQRGRHIVQKRDYLQRKEIYPLWIQKLIDDVYNIPLEIIKDIKNKLSLIDSIESRQKLIKYISNEMIKIGIISQNKKSLNKREHTQHYIISDNMILTDIDNRCKWLIGVIHTMIRKLWEDETYDSKQEIENNVNEIIEMIKYLPILLEHFNKTEIITDTTDTTNEIIQDKKYNYDTLIQIIPNKAKKWLLPKLKELKEYNYTNEDIQNIQNILEKLSPIIDYNEYYSDNEYDFIKSIILDHEVKTFHDLLNILKVNESIIKVCENLYEFIHKQNI